MSALEILERTPARPASVAPLLFVHGACLGAWCWSDHFLDYFAGAGFRAVALNLRGHGKSPGRERLSHARIDDFVEDVATTAARLQSPPIVIGHSMGGLIAQRFGSRYPCSGIVLVCSSPVGGMRRHGLALMRAHPLPFLLAILTRDMRRIYPDNRRVRHIMFSASTPEEIVTRCRERLQTESWRACDEMTAPLAGPYPIACQMLVLGAEHDATVPPHAVVETARAYSAPHRIFPGTGHNLMLEPAWREVAAAIEAWCRGVGDSVVQGPGGTVPAGPP